LYPVEIILPSLFKMQAPTLVCGSSLLDEAARAIMHPYSCQESLMESILAGAKQKIKFIWTFFWHSCIIDYDNR
jgi:hypothetical protein